MTRQQASKALEGKLIEALRLHKIGFDRCKVIGSIVHVECKAASSANRVAEILANFCRDVKVWDSINDDKRAIGKVFKVYKVAGKV